MSSRNIGLYIHIPFCRSKCPYCDFFSYLSGDEEKRAYLQALKKNIADRSLIYADRTVDTLYIGGGTPSCLEPVFLEDIVKCVKSSFRCDFEEVTVECNPADASEKLFGALINAGVNRISMGVQSAVDEERRALGRLSNSSQVMKAIEKAKKSGFKNISLDIMLGVPKQTAKSVGETVDFCLSAGVQHISAYMLKIEENTYFARNVHKLELSSDDETALMYEIVTDKFQKAGFYRYEISNFAKRGFESKHNLKYWNLDEYLGIGPSAHSFMDNKRFFYPRSTEKFIAEGKTVEDGSGGDDRERVMLSLRLSEGLNLNLIKDKDYREFVRQRLSEYETMNLCKKTSSGFAFTTQGFLLSNTILSELI